MLTFHFFLSLAPCSQIDKARADHICPRGLVFINPGNPTGQQLTEDELRGMIKVVAVVKVVVIFVWGGERYAPLFLE